MPLLVLAVCVSAAACIDAAPADGGGAAGQPLKPHVLSSQPLTIPVELDADARQALARHLAAGSLAVARLTLRDMRPTAARALKGVRIFIAKPDADATTTSDDPHYAGSIVLGLSSPESALLNVAPTLTRLRASGALTGASIDGRQPLTITLVPDAWDFAKTLPPEFSLSIERVELEVPPQR